MFCFLGFHNDTIVWNHFEVMNLVNTSLEFQDKKFWFKDNFKLNGALKKVGKESCNLKMGCDCMA